MENELLKPVYQAVLEGNLRAIKTAVQAALDANLSPADILDTMSSAMDEVGLLFQSNEIYVPEMLVAAKTMQRGVGMLQPFMDDSSVGKNGKFIIGTVSGDLHDIGKNLVAMMVETAGFEVIDLGVDVPTERFLEALRNNPDCKLIGLSALLTTTMNSMRETVAAIRAEFPEVKIMVGGAPVTQEFADAIQADAFTEDAAAAASKAKKLLN